MTNPEAPSTAPVAWCRSDDFSAALQKVQSFSGWREQCPDCDMPLYAHPQAIMAPQVANPIVSFLHEIAAEAAKNYQFETARKIRLAADSIAQPQASTTPTTDQAEGPSVDDVAELCAEFEYHIDSDDDYSFGILRDMITAAISRWRAPLARFGDLPEPDPCLEEVVGYVMGWHEIDGKRIRLSIAVLEPCPVDEWRPIARKALKRLTAPPVAQHAAQPVNLAELHAGADPTWQPIETAPRDGTWVLLTGGECESNEESDNRGRVVTAQWTTEYKSNAGDRLIADFGRWEFAYYDSGVYGEYENPTFWQPLPSPPPITPTPHA
jgi:hypothetical protein